MKIIRKNFNTGHFSGNPKEEKVIKDIFTIWVDGAQYSPLYNNVDKKGKRKWDGYYRFYNKNNEFDWGLLEEVEFALNKNKIKYRIVDKSGLIYITNYSISKMLRKHQKKAVRNFFKTNLGITIVPTRGGKTFIASEKIRIVNEFDKNNISLFVVDTIDLFNQTVKEFSKFFNIPESEIGKINDKGVIIKQINVAMIQTMTTTLYPVKRKTDSKDKIKIRNKKSRELRKFLHTVNFLLVDEIQEFSSKQRMNCLKACKNKSYMSGLSATPYKDENIIQNLKIKGFFGGETYKVSIKSLQKQGHLALDKAVLIYYNHEKIKNKLRLSTDTDGYQVFLSKLIHENRERNAILLKIIKICEKNNWKTLMLFNSKKHGYIISDKSNKPFISGDDNSKIRNSEKDKFLSGKGGILLASNIYKKGITLPEAEILVFADGGLEGSNVTQKKGRVLGAVDGKTKAIIMDIMDIEDEYFSEHSLNRLRVYDEEIWKKGVEIYESDDFKGIEESIKEWLDEKKGI